MPEDEVQLETAAAAELDATDGHQQPVEPPPRGIVSHVSFYEDAQGWPETNIDVLDTEMLDETPLTQTQMEETPIEDGASVQLDSEDRNILMSVVFSEELQLLHDISVS